MCSNSRYEQYEKEAIKMNTGKVKDRPWNTVDSLVFHGQTNIWDWITA